MEVTLQTYLDGEWRTAGVFNPDDRGIAKGIAASGTFEYDLEYTLAQIDDLPHMRVGLRYPVKFELYRSSRWPAFLLDIIPSGAGRRVWLRRLGFPDDGPAAEWELLRNGSGNPPGNIRIAEAVIPPGPPHPGFSKEEVVDKSADFIEYAEEHGAVVAGATDVQGDAPKYLLVRDRNLRWHPDGAFADAAALDYWLVKLPRGKTDKDRAVLRNEAPYLEVARRFGLRVGEPLEFINDALFIPRFDRRVVGGKVDRLGLETLSSAAGIAEFGKRGNHGEFCGVINQYANNPKREIIEYIRRDILNAALRNTDNHGRNTAFLKRSDATVALSPLYDFAPMFFDPDGIPRSSRWDEELEPSIGRPDWERIVESLASSVDQDEIRTVLEQDAESVLRLPDTMRKCEVEDKIINGVASRCEEIAEDLRRVRR